MIARQISLRNQATEAGVGCPQLRNPHHIVRQRDEHDDWRHGCMVALNESAT